MVRTVNFVAEVLLPFITNRLLIEGLIRSEVQDCERVFDQILRWQIHYNNGEGSEVIIGLAGNDEDHSVYIDSSMKNISDSSNRKILFAQRVTESPSIGVHGGYLGIHAFYVIFENFLRNLFKHNNLEVKGRIQQSRPINIHIKLTDLAHGAYMNLGLWSDVPLGDQTTAQKRLGYIQLAITEGIVDQDGALIPSGWGTKEMLIAAAQIKGLGLARLHQLNARAGHDSILSVELSEPANLLHYNFDVIKPLRLCVEGLECDTETSTALQQQGVYTYLSLGGSQIVPTEYFVSDKEPGPTGLQDTKEYRFTAHLPMKRQNLRATGLTKPQLEGFVNTPDKLINFLIDAEKMFAERAGLAGPVTLFTNQSGDGFKRFEDVVSNDVIRLEYLEQLGNVLRNSINGSGDPHRLIVIYDYHGLRCNEVTEYLESGNYDNIFYEPYGQGTQTAFLLAHLPSGSQLRHLMWNVITAAYLRVGILDERIQEKMIKARPWQYGITTGIDPLECLKRMRVHIPGEEIDLKNPSEHENMIQAFLTNCHVDLLTVHSGILDKLGKKNPEDVIEWVQMVEREWKIPRVIIHSGRGIPSNIPPNSVRFVGFTAVEHWITSRELKSKYALVQELLSARGIAR